MEEVILLVDNKRISAFVLRNVNDKLVIICQDKILVAKYHIKASVSGLRNTVVLTDNTILLDLTTII